MNEYDTSLKNLASLKQRLESLGADIRKDPEEFVLLLEATSDELEAHLIREERDDKYFRSQAGMNYDLTEEQFFKCGDKNFIIKDRNYWQFKAKFFTNDYLGLMNKYKLGTDDLYGVYDPKILDLDIRALFLGKISRNDLRKWCQFKIKVAAETKKVVKSG